MIEVSNLRKQFSEIEALRGISFSVPAGEIYGLLGPNGAGKSTTIGILCGLVMPDAGLHHPLSRRSGAALQPARRDRMTHKLQGFTLELSLLPVNNRA